MLTAAVKSWNSTTTPLTADEGSPSKHRFVIRAHELASVSSDIRDVHCCKA